MAAPEPHEIYERTRREGRRRLSRPLLELSATAFVGGFDVAFGVALYGLAAGTLAPRYGEGLAHLAGSAAFGIAFVFIVAGRSELFTENFLVPIAGLSRERDSWLKLGELWAVSLVLNVAGGAVLVVLLTSNGVLRPGAQEEITRLADHISDLDPGTAFLSGLVAGALMTLMTWLVEGSAETLGARVALGWIVGFSLVLGTFNHAIVGTIELMYGLRYGTGAGMDNLLSNLGISIAANLVGGLALVTFARSAQAFGAAR